MKSFSSQKAKVLSILKTKGSATNVELNKIGFRYGDCIFRLRKEGYKIVSIRETKGRWRYYLSI